MLPDLVRYTNYYQFGDTFLPDLDKEGSMEEWFYFRLVHRMRVGWENEQHKKHADEGKGRGKGQGTSQKSRTREHEGKREPDPARAAEEGRPMTHAEKVRAAQERFGIEPHEPPETLGNDKPKGFKSTRLKRRGR